MIGIASDAELVLITVLGDAGSGSSVAVGVGIACAANVGADIANMNFGAAIPQCGVCFDEGCIGARAATELRAFIQRSANYGTAKGTLYVVRHVGRQ